MAENSEHTAEKRNLSVLAFAIIIYYLAGGYIDLEQIRLGSFLYSPDRAWVLKWAFWVVLCWFEFRYILTSKKQFRNETLLPQLKMNKTKPVLVNYFRHRFSEVGTFSMKGIAGKQSIRGGELFFSVQDVLLNVNKPWPKCFEIYFKGERPKRINNNTWSWSEINDYAFCQEVKGVEGTRLEVYGFRGAALLADVAIRNSISSHQLTTQLTPHLLFLLAILLGLSDAVGLIDLVGSAPSSDISKQ